MTLRKVILKLHLYLALSAGVFLVILGLTGSIMAFEGDIDRWLHPGLWYVTPRPHLLPENDLVSIAQNRFPGARVLAVRFPRAANQAQVMQLTDGTAVYLNPYDGAVLGSTTGASGTDRFLGWVHQIHLRLVPVPQSAPRLAAAGKIVVSFAGLFLCLLAPSGLMLWWRGKRAAIHWNASWFRVLFDAHQAIGIYAGLFLWIASVTGVLIGFDFGERFFYQVTGSSRPAMPKPAVSAPIPGAAPIGADDAIAIARAAMPGATVAMMVMPLRPTGAFTALMRVPEETSEAVHSSVVIDQYSGKVLAVKDFLTDSPGYRAIRFNRSIHTGDVFGLPAHILVSLSSLALVAMVVTGLAIWWKKLA